MIRKIFLTKEQLSRVVGNILKEAATTDMALGAKLIKKVTGPIKPLVGPVHGPSLTDGGGPTGYGPATSPGSPNQGPSSNTGGPPNTTGDSVPGLNDMYGPHFTDDIGYDNSIMTNVPWQQPTVFAGTNPTYLPGASNDNAANLKMSNDFGINGVSLDTTSGEYDIKLGKQFKKDLKKGKVPQKVKQQHAAMNPNRNKNSSRITNVVHPNGVTRGGVVFDSSFKPGKGGDPFTVKTS